MRLSRAGEYGVRCVLYLSSKPLGQVIPRPPIAAAMGIPEPFLAKIAQLLARAGIIDILQGAKGGYRLRKPPEEISLLEVVEAVMGELFLNDCIIRPESCSRSPSCPVHQVWQRARQALRETLAEANFAKLLSEESCLISQEPTASRGEKTPG